MMRLGLVTIKQTVVLFSPSEVLEQLIIHRLVCERDVCSWMNTEAQLLWFIGYH